MCTLYPCVRTYNTTVATGRTYETLLESSDPVPWGNFSRDSDGYWNDPYIHFDFSLIDTHCLSASETDMLQAMGYGIDEFTRWAFSPIATPWDPQYLDFLPNTTLFDQLMERDCLFTISQLFIRGLKNDLGMMDMLSSPISIDGGAPSEKPGPNLLVAYFGGRETLKQIYDGGKIDFARVDGIFSNISEAITEYIRTNSVGNYSAPATGKVFHYATCLEVNWGWVAYPAVLVGLTILYFSAVVIVTTRKHMPTWKASYLPWLLRGPTRDLWQANSSVHGGMSTTTRAMEEESKAIVLKLVDKADMHLELVQRHGSPASTLPSEDGDSNSTAPIP